MMACTAASLSCCTNRIALTWPAQAMPERRLGLFETDGVPEERGKPPEELGPSPEIVE